MRETITAKVELEAAKYFAKARLETARSRNRGGGTTRTTAQE